jgi:hypothetical protein
LTTTLISTIQLGDPVEHRGIVVAPLFPRTTPLADYVTLDEAIPLGFRVTEVDAAGSVPELRAHNPLDANVLLYDGEELVGAKQNRILNVTVLVGAQAKTTIPVSCVEEGRWRARSEAFATAPHASYPELRRTKAERLSAEPLALGVAQSVVWDEVRAKSARHGARSATGAQADVFHAREDELARLRTAFEPVPGQSGALFALGDRLCLDYVSRPAAFARLYPKLLEGYLLDALERLDGGAAETTTLERFVAAADDAPRSRGRSAGLGDDVRLRSDGVVGSGLELDGELIQLCAFSSDSQLVTRPIMRPSGRR